MRYQLERLLDISEDLYDEMYIPIIAFRMFELDLMYIVRFNGYDITEESLETRTIPQLVSIDIENYIEDSLEELNKEIQRIGNRIE